MAIAVNGWHSAQKALWPQGACANRDGRGGQGSGPLKTQQALKWASLRIAKEKIGTVQVRN